MPRRSGPKYWRPDLFSNLLRQWIEADSDRLKYHFAARVGTSESNIRKLERDPDVDPGVSLVLRIAHELGVSVEELAPFTDEGKPVR